MALKKLVLKPGVNRENTRYTNEGGWYESDKVRFRQGSPEKIGGWARISASTFQGLCRSLWNWITLDNLNLIGVGTNLKFYLELGGEYNDITPIRAGAILNNPFATTNLLTLVTVTDTAHGAITGDFVTFSNVAPVGGLDLNGEYSITYVDANTYTIVSATAATSTVAAGGGTTVNAIYQINVGDPYEIPYLAGVLAHGAQELGALVVRLYQPCVYGARTTLVKIWFMVSVVAQFITGTRVTA